MVLSADEIGALFILWNDSIDAHKFKIVETPFGFEVTLIGIHEEVISFYRVKEYGEIEVLPNREAKV